MAEEKRFLNNRMTTRCRSKRNNCENINDYFSEFTEHSALHGVQYLGEKKRTLAEKFIWFIITVTAILSCSYFIWKTYRKWQESPIIVTVGDALPIEYITFPAVTICPVTKVNENLVDLINKFDWDYQGDLSETDDLMYNYTRLWCTIDDDESVDEDDYYIQYEMDALKFIYNNTPSIEDVFENCVWSGSTQNCSDIFTPTFTEEGICYTFNGLNHSELFKAQMLTFENFNLAKKSSKVYDYVDYTGVLYYPYRITPRFSSGLQVILKTAKNHSSPCMESENGHKIIIHLPSESPHANTDHFYLLPDESANVDLYPGLTIADEDLRSYSIEKRKCIFEDEKDLKFYRYYTENNCKRECYTTATKLLANCSMYYMAHNSTDTIICHSSVASLLNAFGNFMTINHRFSDTVLYDLLANYSLIEDAVRSLQSTCRCFPLCKTLKYQFEVIRTNCNQRSRRRQLYKNEDTTDYSKVKLNFKDIEFFPLEKKALFGAMDFIAYCGGLLGLFIGFSLVSLLEIIYFLTCRPLCNMFLYGRKFWMGHNENEESRPVNDLLEDTKI